MNKIDKPHRYIDHTLLKPQASQKQIKLLCQEAIRYDFVSVCIHPCHLAYAQTLLGDARPALCTVIGFPLGANTTETKVFEAQDALKKGASEIDMVINIGRAIEQDFTYVENEIRAVREALGEDLCLKVILETSLLSDQTVVDCCLSAKRAGASFVKTSTGFSNAGATTHHIQLMRKTVGNDMGVKASGGIRDRQTMQAMIDAGASRIGASSSVKIMEEYAK